MIALLRKWIFPGLGLAQRYRPEQHYMRGRRAKPSSDDK